MRHLNGNKAIHPVTNYLLVTLGLLIASPVLSQPLLSIDSLWARVDQYYPTAQQQRLNLKDGAIVQRGLSTRWYPQINVAGTATYQSKVTSFTIPGLPEGGFPQVPKDQYSIGLELLQTLLEAGVNQAQRAIDRLTTQAQSLSLETETLQIKQTVLTTAVGIIVRKLSRRSYTAASWPTRRPWTTSRCRGLASMPLPSIPPRCTKT